jgi:hypothetical protein
VLEKVYKTRKQKNLNIRLIGSIEEYVLSEPISKNNYPRDPRLYFEEMSSVSKIPLSLLTLILQTAYLKPREDKLLSVLFIGKAGLGKTRLLATTRKLKRVEYVTDITPTYLIRFLDFVQEGKKDYLVIPDFVQCSEGHGRATRTTLIGFLRAMIEEGVSNIADYKMEFSTKNPVKAGLITAITIQSFREFRLKWRKSGFLSRLLPFSFQLSEPTRQQILDGINTQTADNLRKFKFSAINYKPEKVEMNPELLKQLEAWSIILSKQTDSEPFRHQKQLTALAEATAVLNHDVVLKQKHIDFVVWLAHWLNYDFQPI